MFRIESSISLLKKRVQALENRAKLTILFSLFSVLLLSACGFRPVYGQTDVNISAELASIQIEPMPSRSGQVLKYKLEDLLNPDSSYVDPKYTLKIETTEDRLELGIEKDLRVTRYDIAINARYQLVSNENAKVVDSGTSRIKSSFNRTESEFSTFVAEEDAREKASEEMAQEIRAQLVAYFTK